MKKRYLTIFVCMLLLSTILPISIANETEQNNTSGINSMIFCDVHIKGEATVKLLRDFFVLGFGKSFYMKVDLKDGSIEIESNKNPTNRVELTGSYQIHLIGFLGHYSHLLKTRIGGKALIAIWG